MASPRKAKDLKALQKVWYEKLRKTGFTDIERSDGNLEHWSSSLPNRYNPTFFAAREEYYRLAGHLLHEYPFESIREMLIWELHCEGLSIVKIIQTLRKRRIYVKRGAVHKVIKTVAKALFEKIEKSHD